MKLKVVLPILVLLGFLLSFFTYNYLDSNSKIFKLEAKNKELLKLNKKINIDFEKLKLKNREINYKFEDINELNNKIIDKFINNYDINYTKELINTVEVVTDNWRLSDNEKEMVISSINKSRSEYRIFIESNNISNSSNQRKIASIIAAIIYDRNKENRITIMKEIKSSNINKVIIKEYGYSSY